MLDELREYERDPTMDRKTYEREMLKARTMEQRQRDRKEYWQGYKRGLRRAFFGKEFGTTGEHNLYMNLEDDPERDRGERGRGYRDGYKRGDTQGPRLRGDR
jgi:hypothetical protein